MQVEPTRLFQRDVRLLGSAQIRSRLNQVIRELMEADNIAEVAGIERMTALGFHYRIRIGGYRLGITMDGETAILRRFLPRGEIYRRFP